MTIRLLGTGAADGIPAFYSNSRVSEYARLKGGKDVRTRSAALIDGCVKIDLPPDTAMQLNRDGLSAMDWACLIFTHGHDDHFDVNQIQYAMHPFTDKEFLEFPIYANGTIIERIRERYPSWPMELVETKSFNCFYLCKYRVTPIRARHKEDEDAHNLIIERDGRSLLYALDTGIWTPETWEFLKDFNIDALIIECTDGRAECDYDGHLNIKKCAEMVERLREQGTLRAGAPVITSHHSHKGDATHEELIQLLAPHGITPGYDGMEVTV
jgi:phosphoribosyl 1,2-cyclic phosphate phosphodiesterase